jgi:hypothetical protein
LADLHVIPAESERSENSDKAAQEDPKQQKQTIISSVVKINKSDSDWVGAVLAPVDQ